MARRSPNITVMVQAAYKAARGLVRDFGEVENLQVSKKGPADFVTAADIKAERTLRYELRRARPNYGMLLEESGVVEGSDASRRWIVDPLDGTLNFLHGIPHFAISIGLEQDGEIVAGVVYDPLRDELFWAEKGTGAFFNDHRMRVSSRRRLAEAVFATGMPWSGREGHGEYLAQLAQVMESTAGVRRMGSAALDLAYVAAGRYDGFWEPALAPWDIAAGILLVRESGGFISDFAGGPVVLEKGDIVAANDHLHDELKALLAKANSD
jgi:myo-inositol-1(or 4)-monophosphatase